MNRLDRYLLREFLPLFSLILLLFCSFAIFTALIPRAQWITGVPLLRIAYWLVLQFPAALSPLLPIALVITVLLTFGSLTGRNEIQAMRASGISLRRISHIFIILAITITAFSFILNQSILPRINPKVTTLWWQLASGGSGLWRLAKDSLAIGDYNLYFADTDRQNDDMLDVRLELWQDKNLTVIFAERARFVSGGIEMTNFKLNSLDLSTLEAEIDDATLFLRRLIRAENHATTPEQRLSITLGSDFEDILTRYDGGGFNDPRSLSDALAESQNPALSADQRQTSFIFLNNKLIEVFANIILMVVALPIAIQFAHSRSLAFSLSIGIVLIWYGSLLLGQLLAQTNVLPIWLGMWYSSVVFVISGSLLSYRLRTHA